ncbi:MAG: NUDIX domain-containing protein [Ktedonobacteraceae bacterium]
MNALLVRIWRLLRGTPQWYILYLAHRKFIIGVSGVIVNDHGQVLLLRHRFWRPGSWGLPSGYANRNETLENTLCREVREETGLEIEVTRFLRMVSGFRLRLEVSFQGKLNGGSLHLDPKEVVEARFFSKGALPEGLLPSHREIIELAFSTPEPSLVD